MESPVKRSKESKKGRFVPDLNNMEHVNSQLKSKLKLLTVEMKDAVEKMNSMTLEMNTIRNDNLLYKDRLAELEQENALLISQIEEMANERAERDAIIEEFGTAVEARIVEWKEILDEKDATINKLKENLMCAASDRLTNASPDEQNHEEIERLIQDINRRDEIIAELQSKLSEAVVEINESSLLIEKFKSDGKTKSTARRSSKDQREMNKKMQDATKRISSLESLLERAERDAKVKSEQLCEALAILNKYEDENSSLTEAFKEIRELKGQIEKKNQHIGDLVDVVNRLEIENSRFEEAIIVLREKLGITDDEDSSIEDLILQRQQAQEEKLQEMQRNNDQLSSEIVDLKFQIRKLKIALKESLKNKLSKTNGISSDSENAELSLRSESKKEHVELRRIKENVKWVIEENEALRQGMHEILDCIHNQDGKSIVTIQSQTLENLLEALDARHLAGWYHPAMRLQGRVNYLQGSNAELRTQLQQIRKNQMQLQAESQQRPSSVEEGECLQPKDSPKSQDAKAEVQASPARSAKSGRSSHSQNADSGRASGKAADMDEIQQLEDEPYRDTPLEDESGFFGKKSEEVYAMAKEIIAQESEFKKALSDSEQQQRVLEARIDSLLKLQGSLVSPEDYAELRDKYLESSLRLRAVLESKLEADESSRSRATQELRDEVVSLHKQLSSLTLTSSRSRLDAKAIGELEGQVAELKAENEKLRRAAEIAQEEALIHRAIDSTVLAEFNELRQRVLRFEAESEEEDRRMKETARLSLELANYKVIETELRERKKLLEVELVRVRDECAGMRRLRLDSEEDVAERSRKQTDCSEYIEIIDFLQHQYAGSTSLSTWERHEANLNRLNNERNEVKELITKINQQNEKLKIQHETLTSRLQIVEQLKDMLEQQIGSSDVQDIMQKFTNVTRQSLAESKYKLQISQLEESVQRANASLSDYEAKVALMEHEMNKAQKAWRVQKAGSRGRPACADKAVETVAKIEESSASKQTDAKLVQTELAVRSAETQCALCRESDGEDGSRKVKTRGERQKDKDESEIGEAAGESGDEAPLKAANIALLQEQLGQALTLASERSVALSKCESQLAEYRARIVALTELLDAKSQLVAVNQQSPDSPKNPRSVATSEEALRSTISSLEKIIAQKEETIGRYQSLIKEDRDKHSEAAARLHDEIKSLRRQIAEKMADNALVECPEKDLSVGEATLTEEEQQPQQQQQHQSILREKISRLETELSISAELAERWHRLAEDRLRHMDSTRARLEEQHREEIESYRTELNKRQYEVDQLRRQLSESRRAPTTKTEVISFMKALQIKDNRLADEIENELEEHAVAASRQLSATYVVEDSRCYEFQQSQAQLDRLRKQLSAAAEREKSLKNELAELQQQLSKRCMAVKAQEKKASRREMQLEKKVKELEEELQETKGMLERHFMVQQAKRAKTAEDLGLWDKLKRWQQTAERLKERLKEKTEECQRLQSNYEKLRSLIACMEREKWYLRGRYRAESLASAWPSPAPSSETATTSRNNEANALLVEELQRECLELRERVSDLLELIKRRDIEELERRTSEELERRANEELERRASVEEKKRDAFESNCIDTKMEKMKTYIEVLEKENLKLETENFELRLDLERDHVNVPRLHEKIEHLEKYVELLKAEKSIEPNYSSAAAPRRDGSGTQRTKAELERTVVTLKKLIEKLQFENKKLRSSLSHCDVDSTSSTCNCHYLRQNHEQAKRRIVVLETELELADKRIAVLEELAAKTNEEDSNGEVALLRQQLNKKSELLSKVKDLLAKAASNEKALRHRIQQLEFKQTLSIIPECGSTLAIAES